MSLWFTQGNKVWLEQIQSPPGLCTCHWAIYLSHLESQKWQPGESSDLSVATPQASTAWTEGESPLDSSIKPQAHRLVVWILSSREQWCTYIQFIATLKGGVVLPFCTIEWNIFKVVHIKGDMQLVMHLIAINRTTFKKETNQKLSCSDDSSASWNWLVPGSLRLTLMLCLLLVLLYFIFLFPIVT